MRCACWWSSWRGRTSAGGSGASRGAARLGLADR
jgi:hypothetical protein